MTSGPRAALHHVGESLRDSHPVSERPDYVGCGSAALDQSWSNLLFFCVDFARCGSTALVAARPPYGGDDPEVTGMTRRVSDAWIEEVTAVEGTPTRC